MISTEPVLYRVADGIAIVTINRPEAANTIDEAMSKAFADRLHQADDDPAVRVVVVTGTGSTIFCAGMDLRAFAAKPPGAQLDIDARFLDFARSGIRKPTIAAVNGAAVGGGFELVLACDMVIAAEHARFGSPEVKVGLLAGGGGTLLPRRLPLPVAYELGLTGDLISAQRALALGLVNAVVPGPEVMSNALELASRIAANAPLATMATKYAMRVAAEADAAAAWAATDEVTPTVGESADAREGALAFNEHRPPQWQGR
ncbi:MAG: short chain enoyl-CoA hydratase [Acidimicrobiia bacterium]|nr:short chain enoyl-CoA hydratase [Acidimicrobiia bacterium]